MTGLYTAGVADEGLGFDLSNNASTSDVISEAENLLSGGASASKVYASIVLALPGSEWSDTLSRLEALLVKRGLHPDSPVASTCYFIHRLGSKHPPFCGSKDTPVDKVSLAQLLDMRPTPNLTTSTGGTALHLLASMLLNRRYLPDKSPARNESMEDSWRAGYLTTGFPQMLEAGYSPTQPDNEGMTVVQMLHEAYIAYGNEVKQLRYGGRPAAVNADDDEGPLDMQVAIRRALEAFGEAPAASSFQMRFGKYVGRLLTELPAGYVLWMCQEPGFFNVKTSQKAELLENLMQLDLVRRGGEEEGGELWPAWAPSHPRRARMTFGKHKGMLLSDVGCLDPTYIDWMCREPDFFDGTPRKDALKRQLVALGLVREVAGKAVPAGASTRPPRSNVGFDGLFGHSHKMYYEADGADYGYEYDGDGDIYGMNDEGHELGEWDSEADEQEEEEAERRRKRRKTRRTSTKRRWTRRIWSKFGKSMI